MHEQREWSIQQVSRLSGATSRTLRHYGAVGILPPSRTDANGHRFYDADALVRLQRILLLRGLGLGIPTIAEVLNGNVNDADALEQNVGMLRRENLRIARQIDSVTATITTLRKGSAIMAEQMFEGFDPAQYEQEVRESWGDEAADRSDRWWRRLSDADKRGFVDRHHELQDLWDALQRDGEPASGARARDVARRHAAWIADGWAGRRPDAEALRGIADMYVADPRFAKNYTREFPGGAAYVRDAIHALL